MAGLRTVPEEYYYPSARFYIDGINSFGMLNYPAIKFGPVGRRPDRAFGLNVSDGEKGTPFGEACLNGFLSGLAHPRPTRSSGQGLG